MPPSLGPIAGGLMIMAGLALLCSTRSHHQHARTFRLLGVSWMISGAAWFVPPEATRMAFMFAGAALSAAVVIQLMITTWRQASIHQ